MVRELQKRPHRTVELFLAIARRSCSFEAKDLIIAHFLAMSEKQYRTELECCRSDALFRMESKGPATRLISYTSSAQVDEPTPNWIIERMGEFLRVALNTEEKEARKSAEILFAFWPTFGSTFPLGSLTKGELEKLMLLLDFFGLHTESLAVWQKSPGTRAPLWPMIRGVGEQDPSTVPAHIQCIQRSEISDTSYIRDCVSRGLPENARLGNIRAACKFLVTFMVSIPLLLIARFFLDFPRLLEKSQKLAENEKHWERSGQGLAHYWFDIKKTSWLNYEIWKTAVCEQDVVGILRACDWTLFSCYNHMPIPGSEFLYSILKWLAKGLAPYLVADITMHQAIFNYYVGNLKRSLVLHAEVDWLLQGGRHPFDEVINLSNSIRTTLAIRLPLMTTSLFRKVEEHPRFKKGFHNIRTRLVGFIQQYREDHVIGNFDEHVLSVREAIAGTPAMPKSTILLLLTLAYIEQGKAEEAKRCLAESVVELKLGNLHFAYSKILALMSLRISTLTGRRWRLKDILVLATSRWFILLLEHVGTFRQSSENRKQIVHECSFYFRSPALLENTSFMTPFFSKETIEARSFADLTKSLRQFLKNQFPDFRFKIKIGNETAQSDPEIDPITLARFDQVFGGDSENVGVHEMIHDSGARWLILRQSLALKGNPKGSGGAYVLVACPNGLAETSAERIKHLEQSLIWCAYAASRIEAQQLHEEVEADAKVGKMAAQVAHDIRSPLAALNVAVSDLDHLPEDQRILLREATRRITDIANELSSKHRNEVKNPVSHVEPKILEHIPCLIDQIVSEKRLQYRSKTGLNIEAKLDSTVYDLFVSVEPTEFRRVLSNLINNSVEAIRDAGNVRIEAGLKKEGVVSVRVVDTGRGMSEEVLGRLGHRGFTYGKSCGSGLGFNHAVETVRNWQGEIEVTTKEGFGTQIEILLPTQATPGWHLPRLSLTHANTVVIVDDDPSIHEIWRKRISGKKKTVHFFNCEDAEQWVSVDASRTAQSVFLIDYDLGRGQSNGLDLIRRLHIAHQAVLVTSHADSEHVRSDCSEAGVSLLSKSLTGMVPLSVKDVNIPFEASALVGA
jgi:signal transduction histidine kinase